MFDSLREKIESVFSKLKKKGKLTEADVAEALRALRMALLEADVNYKVVKEFISRIQQKAVGEELLSSLTPVQQVMTIVYKELIELLGGDTSHLVVSPKPPTVYMMVGLQGSGKTTTCVKLAKRVKRQGHRPMVVAADVKRPAAVKQLQLLAERADIQFFGIEGEKDPLKVVRKALEYRENVYVDTIIIDTAGRLHIDEELMNELESMESIVSPHEVLLVVDAMTGQEAVNVAQEFHKKLKLTGTILTKLDGDARGGSAMGIRFITGVPIKLAGIGEKIEDIEPFAPDRIAQRILGMGDIQTLIEKAQNSMAEDDVDRLAKRIQSSKFTLDDFLLQLQQIKKMGSIGNILDMLPLPGKLKNLKNVEIDEKRIKHVEAVIQSMTPEERRKPDIIKASRKKRIAAGSGTTVQLVNQVLKQHEEMLKMVKTIGKGRKGSGMFRGLFG